MVSLALTLCAVADPQIDADKLSLVMTVNAAIVPPTPALADAPCAFPTVPAATPEQTAWQLFVAANCPSNAAQVVWENWIEQLQLYPANGSIGGTTVAGSTVSRKRLHGSPLARLRLAQAKQASSGFVPLLDPTSECTLVKKENAPKNMLPNSTICEEVRLNPDAQTFISSELYELRPSQTQAAVNGVNIQFPVPAVEVKIDWIPASDFAANATFNCTDPPAGIHVETIDGVCYALAGMHISSKLLPNWLWATFEPQSMLTNPFRCITFGPCNDPFGSLPATSNGGVDGFTKQSSELAALMSEAGLAPEFSNYRLDGAQVAFLNNDGSSSYLGNSIIEGENAGLTGNEASCITCHSISSVKNDNTDGLYILLNVTGPLVGPQYEIPADWIARDFVWSMALACPDPTKTGLQACTGSPSAPLKGKRP